MGQLITVKMVSDCGPGENGDPLAGHVDLTRGLLTIRTDQSPDQIADTFLHESLHVMLLMVGHDSEELVWRLSPVLLQWLRDNPRAVEYLTGRATERRRP